MHPDAYTYTILLSVCSNLLPREDLASRFSHAKTFFDKCCDNGYVNDYVLRKLRQTVLEEEYHALLNNRGGGSATGLPASWTRSVGRNPRVNVNKGRKNGGWSKNRKGR